VNESVSEQSFGVENVTTGKQVDGIAGLIGDFG